MKAGTVLNISCGYDLFCNDWSSVWSDVRWPVNHRQDGLDRRESFSNRECKTSGVQSGSVKRRHTNSSQCSSVIPINNKTVVRKHAFNGWMCSGIFTVNLQFYYEIPCMKIWNVTLMEVLSWKGFHLWRTKNVQCFVLVFLFVLVKHMIYCLHLIPLTNIHHLHFPQTSGKKIQQKW